MKEREVLVRYTNKNGPCMVLGALFKETKLYYFYRTLKKEAYISKSKVHLEPCLNCADHPKGRYNRRH